MDPSSLVTAALAREGLVIFLTGAGISAESGIPTFRGPEGYWTEGSTVYHPQELATHEAFTRSPEVVWNWYLHRRKVCRSAEPNDAHRALVDIEGALGDRFLLITQNVDGLHLRAGNTAARCYEIHGNIDYMRCARGCALERLAIVDGQALECRRCGGRARPHVLWFDESYDEELYRFESSLRAADRCALMITVGTSAATNLPVMAVQRARNAGAKIVDVNIGDNDFARAADLAIASPAAQALPTIRDLLWSSARGR